ncbi:amidohydrolase family protein [Congregibacter litoralis]|uniref:Dihydroorotase n=1 Tax=Congregibacter litoralis KT71 TaxID=314285 RepID=A4AE03_9GAMM|nr:amidohydrolase family protein [Congregibacter litoralis]EAQ95751.1 Dihydroorotase [Congregibacter litoralis KT71]
MYVISGAECFDPSPRGHLDLLVAGSEVVAMGESGSFDAVGELAEAERVDARGKLLMPGIVDALTHPCGGGGEGGFGNRTAEIDVETFVRAGVTAPVGALGTDSIGRSLEVLYGNVMGMRRQGLNAFMLSGAYRVPAPSLTGDIARDVYLVSPVVGVGEVAIADHRGTQPTAQELRRLAAETQLGGILAGEGGTVLVHVGAGESRLKLLRDALEGSDLSPSVLYPTHVNRSTALLDEAADWALRGGFVDITVSTTPELIAAGDITSERALRRLLEAGAPAEKITLSSDAGGSLPVYVDGELVGLTAASPDSLPELLLSLHSENPDLFPVALAGMTRNPAAALKLADAGAIAVGGRADLLLLDPAAGAVESVMAGGQWLLRRGEFLL